MSEWKKVIIPVQHMFPNCQVKYKTKCTDMKSCDMPIPEKIIFPREFLDPVDVKVTKPPKDFENCTDTLLAFLKLQKNLGKIHGT